MRRRAFLATGSLALAGCRPATQAIEGGFTGIGFERGHLLRPASSASQGADPPPPSAGLPNGPPLVTRRVHTLIAGGGVAGLAAARALRQRGMDDFACWSWKTAPVATAAGGPWAASPARWARTTCPCPVNMRTRCRTCSKSSGLRQRRGGPLGVRRAPPVPQPAGAAVFQQRVAGRPAARAGRRRGHAGAVPALCRSGACRAGGRAFCHAGVPGGPAGVAPGAGCHHFQDLAGPRRPERPAAALVPRLLLP
jgi:hypothetical protein